jgi:hypothetical protein
MPDEFSGDAYDSRTSDGRPSAGGNSDNGISGGMSEGDPFVGSAGGLGINATERSQKYTW